MRNKAWLSSGSGLSRGTQGPDLPVYLVSYPRNKRFVGRPNSFVSTSPSIGDGHADP
jgi:hypothetical protein